MDNSHPMNEAERFFADEQRGTGYNRAWFNLIRVHRKLYPRITRMLKSEGIRDPIWYEILLHLENAGPDGRRMQQLEDMLFVAQYALSRHVARMQEEGLLERRYIAEGRRKQVLILTEKGRGIHARIWPRYVEAIRTELAPHMSIEEAYGVAYGLRMLLP